ncbi:MAG: ROK family protein [Clostridia bacterium]|nr:ROK family protein [Clostridia bacterium]
MKKRFAIGVDLGGTNIKAGLVELTGEKPEIVLKKSIPTALPRPASEICRDIADLCGVICEEAGISLSDVGTVGVGSPGSVSGGIVHNAENLGFSEVPLRDMISDLIGGDIGVSLANDANAAAYGELVAGCGVGCSSIIAVTLGTGVGGGIVLDGKIVEGHNGAAGEIGHIIIKSGGRLCACGCRGCLEAYCSATALIAETKEKIILHPESMLRELSEKNGISGKTAFDAARLGDLVAKEIIGEYVENLAAGVASVIQMFQPEVVCIGGGISKEGEGLIAPLRDRVYSMVYQDVSIERTRIVAAQLGNDAGIIGAASIPC